MNDQYADRTPIIVIGYPRSGNTWLSRLLGEVLNSPVTGAYAAKPLCTEGLDRLGDYVVRQLHLKVSSDESPVAIPNAWWFHWRAWHNERLVLVARDPRDIVVSAAHHWQRETLQEALDSVCYGRHPLLKIGPWADYVSDWYDCPVQPHLVKYEDLHADTAGILFETLQALNLGADMPDLVRIRQAVRVQGFDAKKAQIKIDGNERPYGRTIQQRHLRAGRVGDWREMFSPEQEAQAWDCFGDVMGRLGYER